MAVKSTFTKEYQQFLRYLIAERKKAGLTQNGLAQRLQKPQSFVSKYETGERRLDVAEFIQIARAIGLSPSRIIEQIENTPPLSSPEGREGQ